MEMVYLGEAISVVWTRDDDVGDDNDVEGDGDDGDVLPGLFCIPLFITVGLS